MSLGLGLAIGVCGSSAPLPPLTGSGAWSDPAQALAGTGGITIPGTGAWSDHAQALAGTGAVGPPAGYTIWLRADKGITLATGVSAWADQSGNGYGCTQGNTVKQPAYFATGGPNNLAYLGIVGVSGSELDGSAPTISKSASTIFIVHKFASVASAQCSFLASSAGSGGVGFAVGGGSSGDRDIILPGVAYEVETSPAATTSWEKWCGIFGSGTQALRVNGAARAISPNTDTPGNPTAGYTIGSDAGALNMTGGVAEILVYGTLTLAVIQEVEAYLLARYGF